jgi:hypothetical protein
VSKSTIDPVTLRALLNAAIYAEIHAEEVLEDEDQIGQWPTAASAIRGAKWVLKLVQTSADAGVLDDPCETSGTPISQVG